MGRRGHARAPLPASRVVIDGLGSKCFRLAIPTFICYKEIGHENHKKGWGFIALDPSLTGSWRLVAGAKKPGQQLLCLLLWQKLPHAFVAFLNARRLPHVQGAPLEFHVCVQLFAACARNRTYYSGTFNL